MIVTSRDKPFYITIRDPKTNRSKTVTVRGKRLTIKIILNKVIDAMSEDARKAG